MPLKDQIIDRVTTRGSLSVAEYMELCTAHYYATRDPFGTAGDFTTSPEISQVFGELIGAWLQDAWQNLSASQALLCELGPGRGTLMKDILRVTRNSGLRENSDVLLVENSPKLMEMQKRTLAYAHTRMRWQDSLDNLPPLPLFLVANEFFDALPIQQYTDKQERRIICIEGKLSFWPEGKVIREESPASIAIITRIASHIKACGGAALIIDYGYTDGSKGDTLQAVKAHAYADPLAEPGEADITAHVDFRALKQAAEKAGAYVSDIVEQGTFLTRLGAELRASQLCKTASHEQQEKIMTAVDRLISPAQMGGLFKAMAITSEPITPVGF